MIVSRTSFLVLMTAALMVRAAVLWFGFNDLHGDPDAYARLAVTWDQTGTFGFEGAGRVTPTAFRPPLYPWLLSFLVAEGEVMRLAVAGLHLALGSGTVALTYLIGCRLNLRFAWLAGLAVACDPILMRQSQLVMTETLVTFVAALGWWLGLIVWPVASQANCDAQGRSGIQWVAICGLGLVLGASVLVRPTAAAWAVLCIQATLFFGNDRWQRRLNDCLLLCMGLLVCLGPWTLRNWSAFGKPIWSTTHGGYTLLLANNPPLYRHFAEHGPSRAWDAEEFQQAWEVRLTLEDRPDVRSKEIADDQLAYQAARSTIARQPQMFVLSCFYRVGWLWALWPHDGSIDLREVQIAFWYAVCFSGALCGLRCVVRTRACHGWLVGLLLVFSLTAVHAVYWSNMRMRSPAMPCVILLAVSMAGYRLPVKNKPLKSLPKSE